MNKLREIVKMLDRKCKTIGIMESCTGGALVNEITNIEGASKVIKFGAVAYSNEYKIKMGVDKDIIDKYTVYSTEVSMCMAKAICDYTNCDYGIGVTGKLNRSDVNNKSGKDNEVFYSIYSKDEDDYYCFNFIVKRLKRDDNKKDVINDIINSLYEILK